MFSLSPSSKAGLHDGRFFIPYFFRRLEVKKKAMEVQFIPQPLHASNTSFSKRMDEFIFLVSTSFSKSIMKSVPSALAYYSRHCTHNTTYRGLGPLVGPGFQAAIRRWQWEAPRPLIGSGSGARYAKKGFNFDIISIIST